MNDTIHSAADTRPTSKQGDLFVKLVRERRDEANVQLAVQWFLTATRAQVSDQISRLLSEPKPAAPPTQRQDPGVFANPLEPGMYRTPDERMYRVYPARSGGHLLAKELKATTANLDFPGNKPYYFEYAGAAARFVTAADKLSREEARAWGRDFGTCCFCGALLTDPESVRRGSGPVCDGRMGV